MLSQSCFTESGSEPLASRRREKKLPKAQGRNLRRKQDSTEEPVILWERERDDTKRNTTMRTPCADLISAEQLADDG